ncbi:hypothetical protein EON65_14990 [archaeon]|nr:MAG: hypothetical protein EON65_14990 [archaeon]
MSLNATIKTGMELERIVEDTCHKYRAEGPSATARPCDLSLLYTTNKAQFPTVMYIPGLDALPVWGMYSIEQILEKHSSEISKEYKSRQAEAKKGKIEKDVQSSNAWEVINLMAEGSWIEENVHLFPRTVGIVRQLPLMETG